MDTIQLNEQEQINQPTAPDRLHKVRSFWGIIFSQVGFFWAVLLVFMAVSVTESGAFFNAAITHDVADGVLGYAVAATFDLLSLVFMLARLNASRIADRRGEWLSLFGVILCAGVSAFANTASAVQAYDASQFNHIPAWMSTVAPYLGCAFPLMIIVVSIISDHVGDLNPQRADSIEKYRAKEMKKVQLLKVRLEIERELVGVRRDMAGLHSKPSRKQLAVQASMQAHTEVQLADLQEEIAGLKMLLAPAGERNTDAIAATVQVQEAAIPLQIPAPETSLANEKQIYDKNEAASAPIYPAKFESAETRVAEAMQANPGAPIEQIAQVAGCTVRTAEKWVKHLTQAEK